MTPEKALNIIAGFCSKKEYCSKDIREKLLKWQLQEKEINKIMDFLYQHQFIDDARYAKIYTEDKFRFNHWGKQKITLMLRQKGISQEIIEHACEALKISDYEESCLEIIKQKRKTLSEEEPYKLKAKLTRFALGRGFDYDTIHKSIDELFSSNPD